jgi:hypothetical protein
MIVTGIWIFSTSLSGVGSRSKISGWLRSKPFRGWSVVEIYIDHGISRAKRREKRLVFWRDVQGCNAP